MLLRIQSLFILRNAKHVDSLCVVKGQRFVIFTSHGVMVGCEVHMKHGGKHLFPTDAF